jgi:hypothetical protein
MFMSGMWFGLGTTVVETYGDVQENRRTCKISLSIKMVYLRVKEMLVAFRIFRHGQTHLDGFDAILSYLGRNHELLEFEAVQLYSVPGGV